MSDSVEKPWEVNQTGKWVKATRGWRDYPIGTKARCSWEGGYWEKTERGWKWWNGSTFPTPGNADQVLEVAE